MKTHRLEKYLRVYGFPKVRPLVASSLERVKQTIVIPVLAERSSLFRTLASIAQNPPEDLLSTLVICVVNNCPPHLSSDEEIRDNQDTLHLLKALIIGNCRQSSYPADLREDLHRITASDIRLAFIDAASPGLQLPEGDCGVGTARKIGMDAALEVIIRPQPEKEGLICCLDADTLVEENYLPAIRAHFGEIVSTAAVTAYAHQEPVNTELLAAICCYETFLRSYVIGLSYASSPYAYHAIGSTIVCTTDGYVAVRGMNRRAAAEDFYFLNKVAKVGRVGTITTTRVFPSPRASRRVPFGTGQRIHRFLAGGYDEYRVYDPRIFVLLRQWLARVEANPDRDSETILSEARGIHVCLEEFLRQVRIDKNWDDIRSNCRDLHHLRHQFHVWFDGLKTFRMIRHLSRTAFPLVPMFDGLASLIDMMGLHIPLRKPSQGIPALDDQYEILQALRTYLPAS